MQKMLWFTCGMLLGLSVLSIGKASVPSGSRVTDDTAIYQKVSEIHVQKQAKLDFDAEVARLSQQENRFNEKLPSLANHPRLKGPIQRISRQKYRFSGKKTSLVQK